MRNKMAARATAMALLLTLSTGTAMSMLPRSVQAASEPAIGAVSVNGGSSFELKKIQMLPDPSGNIVTFTVNIHNKGNSDLSLVDYWFRLKGKSGNAYSVRMMPQDKVVKQVGAHSNEEITYYAKVGSGLKLQDLQLQIIKWDSSQANFEKVLGQVSIPASYTGVTPKGESASFQTGSSELKLSTQKFTNGKNEKYYLPAITLRLENTGGSAVVLPDIQYSLRTPEGLLYPLEAKKAKDLTISPKDSKDIQLTGTIPLKAGEKGWELVLTQIHPELKFNTLLAAQQLPAPSETTGGEAGRETQFMNKSGLYTANLSGIYRLPWEDQDILTANLRLSNQGEQSLPIPDMTAYFLLDNAVRVEAKIVRTDKVIGIDPGAVLAVEILGKIPYTYEYKEVKLVLQEKESETQMNDLLELTAKSELQKLPFIGLGSTYKREDTGRKASYTVSEIHTYAGLSGNIVSAELDIENLEKRFTPLTGLVAHFQLKDGKVYPATVSEIKKSIAPNGKARANVWTTIPEGVDMENVHLLLGDAVTLTEGTVKQTGAQQAAKPDAYVKPMTFALPKEKNDVKDKLKDLDLFPYIVSFSRINTSINTDVLSLKFDYNIRKKLLTESSPDGHKLVLVFEDFNGKKSFEKSYDLKNWEPREGQTAEQVTEAELRIGSKEQFEIRVQDADLIYKQRFLEKFHLSVYHEFQGQRKMIARQSLDWFVFSD
ncbi:hypothetical protein [Paenibacillus sp. FJAT-26967]|uniref:hypothetical protein n=1 Tax=Paenibacillus sp. FJAT-26967 TaxID=1729690 RepID=UPI000838542B|nr:hypothetical protein [Paenibacillus sp. FJAT-26967]